MDDLDTSNENKQAESESKENEFVPFVAVYWPGLSVDVHCIKEQLKKIKEEKDELKHAVSWGHTRAPCNATMPLHSPAIILGTGLLACMALGYLLGEMIYHVAKCYALSRHGNRGGSANADTEVGVVAQTETERIREERKEKLNEGTRKLNLLPLVSYNSKDNTSRSKECAICLEDFEEDDVCRVVTGCNHAFHALCADAWLKVQQRCPLCRGDI